jgi:hypothetical protein
MRILALILTMTCACAALDRKDVEYARPGGKPVLLVCTFPTDQDRSPPLFSSTAGGLMKAARAPMSSRCST